MTTGTVLEPQSRWRLVQHLQHPHSSLKPQYNASSEPHSGTNTNTYTVSSTVPVSLLLLCTRSAPPLASQSAPLVPRTLDTQISHRSCRLRRVFRSVHVRAPHFCFYQSNIWSTIARWNLDKSFRCTFSRQLTKQTKEKDQVECLHKIITAAQQQRLPLPPLSSIRCLVKRRLWTQEAE